MGERETCQAALERQLICELVNALSIVRGPEERRRYLSALIDLVHHADSTLDASQLDPYTRAYLEQEQLWQWPSESTNNASANARTPRALLQKTSVQNGDAAAHGGYSHGKH